ncbi:MAG: deoxyribodipyrimidine photo-lyase [Campylobacterota bacterium]|nr:deoxyribodipyrimidine photo-lyase [Campylobacterota bacterium]
MRRILWFRRDLRREDNLLLSQEGDVLPIFIFDPAILGSLPKNDRRVTFIFNALLPLKSALRARGLDLAIFYGKPVDVFEWLLKNGAYNDVCASGDYDAYALSRDRDISHLLEFTYLQDTYIFHPDEVLKKDKTPYQVFTPFYNCAKTLFTPAHMIEYLPCTQSLIEFDYTQMHRIDKNEHSVHPICLESIGFEPQSLISHQKMSSNEKLELFVSKLNNYSHDRDYMMLDATSFLSIDLRFGTISVRALLRWLVEQKKAGLDTDPFFRQLIFRDFYAMLLYHFPHLATQNFRYRFEGIPNDDYFKAFCTAQTGVPIVDAGVRELLETGEMHNRVRMICASFFTKNLLLPWQWGEAFFAHHLMDYDAASNILSWQWSAGTGVDPQPYFRIFNPTTQSEKFDKAEVYRKRHLPSDYTRTPIVDHKESSKKALEYFKSTL